MPPHDSAVRGADTEKPGRRAGVASARPLRVLIPFIARYKAMVAVALLALMVAAIITLVVPVALRRVIDSGFSETDANLVNNYFMVMILVVALLAVTSAARFYFLTWLGERVVADLRVSVFSHLLALDPGFYDKSRVGELLSRLTADTTQIKTAVGSSVSLALRNFVLMAGSLVMMIVTSPSLSGLVLLTLPLIVLPLVFIGRWVRKLSRLAQDTLADTSAFAGEYLGAIRAVQSFTQESRAAKVFAGVVEASFDAARLRMRARAMLSALAIFLIFSSVVLILWWGAKDVLTGAVTGGELGQFVLYSVFAAASIGELAQVWGEIQITAGAAERLAELLSVEPKIVKPAGARQFKGPVRGKIDVSRVEFAYPTRSDEAALTDISFAINPGERVALVGPSGAGKSTVFALLQRFYDPQSGSISIDAVPVDQLDPQELRRSVAVVPQEAAIFAASAADNILFGKPGASAEAVRAAARAAQADDFIASLPNGYDTMLGERGATLSGGQCQRLAIARALLKDAPILLLDEATSALDAQSEDQVQAALERLMQGRTTLVIAHRLATILGSNRILVIDGGRIVAQGTHDELVKDDGLYADLARRQFQAPTIRRAARTNGQSPLPTG
ncbi:MAG: ABC transporter transmembrane domain-containing protein [Hyphomicrobiales bacterium]